MKPKKVTLPPVPEVRTIELNREERQFIEALLTDLRMQVAALRKQRRMPEEEAQKAFAMINRISDKVMPEEEAAAELQALGFTIVKKEG